jgi:hypothetical protein
MFVSGERDAAASAVERHASAKVLEDAQVDATLAGHDAWVREGRPGARPHDEVMAELLGQ